ncbi:biotin--[acetyl-CoA-carboxylase] ligase [Umezawaea beigongshangensis]|uniref:biotin--[acetyl-CoA-carboxylase] ligase n=1 Tax=Umezawaea beigongshangensis TaxID=2780383 RepID=UPI0018F24B04|nr:biotin--[acetyl-CoA-carboxylase] ligase [Umezawaea beigongshangensis]
MSEIDAAALRERLVAPAGPYDALEVVASTASTNADLTAAATAGAADRTVLVADEQTAGRGRRGRGWVSPPGSGLYVSVLLRPAGVPADRLSWLTLLAGIALARLADSVGVEAVLKWPNDLLLGPGRGKGAGVLAEVVGDAVVLGTGLNVAPLPDGVQPAPGGLLPTSLADAGATVLDRTELAARLLLELADVERAWRDAGGDPHVTGLHEEYLTRCATIGSRVRVELTGRPPLVGTGAHLGIDGTLVVRTDDGAHHPVSAGDVVHVRSA